MNLGMMVRLFPEIMTCIMAVRFLAWRGLCYPSHNIRKFSTDFFKMKKALFAEEIKKSQRPPAKWEKKGADHFRVSKIEDPTIRETFIKPINTIIHKLDGHIFYVGVSEKPP